MSISEKSLPYSPEGPAQQAFDALDRSGIGLALTDSEDRFIYVSAAHARIYGRRPEDLLGKTWRDLVPAGVIPEQEEAARKCLERGEVFHIETPGFRGDGSLGYHQVAAVPLTDDQATYAGHVCIVQDVTDRRLAQEALKESEEKFRGIIESTSDAVMLTRPDGVISYLSPATRDVLGWEPEELVGTQPWIIDPADLDMVKEAHRRALEGESGSKFEYRIRTKAGEQRWVSHSWSPILRQGRLLGIVSVVRDITGHKRAEAALRQERDRARTYLDVAEVVLLALDAEGRVTLINKKGCQVLGCTEEEALGKDWFETFLPQWDRDKVRAFFRRCIAGEHGTEAAFENVVLTAGGERFLSWRRTLLYDGAGEVVGVLSSGEDITERKRAEKELERHREHLEQLVAERTIELQALNAQLQREVAERKQTEEALRASEHRYRHLFESLNDAAFVADAETGVILEANKRAEILLGRTRDEIVGMHQTSLHPPAEAEWYRRLFATHAGRQGEDLDALVIKKNGAVVPVSISSAVTTVGGHRIVLGLFRDINERRRAEEALRESEERYRAVVEDQTELICRFEPGDWRLTFVNGAYCRFLGKPCKELIGHSFMPFVVPEDREMLASVLASLTPESPGATHENRATLPNGEVRWLQWTDRAFFDEKGHAVEMQSVGRDITERKQAEEALRESEERYHSLFENNHSTMLLIDPVTGRIVDANPAACRFYGYSREEMMARRIYDINTLGREKTLEEMGKAVGWRCNQFFFRHRLASGEVRDVEVFSGPITVRGQQLLYSIIHDITERKLAEEELKESRRKLEEANRAKDEFLSLASHELKTPVTSIKIFSELATRRPHVMEPKHMRTLTRQADQLIALVNDLLDVSRLELGRMPVQMMRLDLAALVSETCERYHPRCEKNHALSCPVEDGVHVLGDPVRLEQVFSNLLDNAHKYTPDGRGISMRIGCKGGKALVEVQDEGIGIGLEHLPHIFERFYKPGPQHGIYSGLGVGLYISREIVERHGGRIWAESEEGRGSTFTVELPLAPSGG